MGQNTNHHFVPQFYLRNFGSQRHVAIYNLSRGCHIPHASIKDQCQRAHLYGPDSTFENALAPLEGEAARVIRRIIATGEPPSRASEDEIYMLYFILLQWRRTPATAAAVTAQATELARWIARDVLPPELRDAGKSLRAACDLPEVASLQLAADAVPALFDLTAKVLVNKTPAEFIASDSPVVLFNQWCQQAWGRGAAGLASRGLQILLPVSPDHVLVLYDAAVYRVGRDGQRSVDVTKAYDVVGINRLQLMVAEENLYYSGARETADAIDRLPLELRQTQASAVRSETVPRPDRGSELLYLYSAPPSIKLNVSCISIRDWARRVPPDQRQSTYREAAVQVYEKARESPSLRRRPGPRSEPPGEL